MPTTTSSHRRPIPSPSSLLDQEETNQHPTLPYHYREYLAAHASTEYHTTSNVLDELWAVQDPHRLQKVQHCRTHAYFAMNKTTRKVRVISNACRDRWCYFCSLAKASKVADQLQKWVKTLNSPKLLTLTLTHNDDPLDEQIDRLYRHFRNFRRAGFVQASWSGGAYFAQITWNDEKAQWHPHIHAIVDGHYIPQRRLSNLWRSITHDSRVVDVRAVRDTRGAVKYVSRYVSRPVALSELPHRQALIAVMSLHGRRLSGTWGTARTAKALTPPKTDHKDWLTLVYWSAMNRADPTPTTHHIILHCWYNDLPIPDHLEYDLVEHTLIPVIKTPVDDPYLFPI